MDFGSLKRKEGSADLDTSTSPTKKQAVHKQTAFQEPSTKLCKSGEPVWRNKGVEGVQLEKSLKLFHTSNGTKGYSTDPNEISKEDIEKIRLSESYWSNYTHQKFAATYRKYAKRIRAEFNLEADIAGQRKHLPQFKEPPATDIVEKEWERREIPNTLESEVEEENSGDEEEDTDVDSTEDEDSDEESISEFDNLTMDDTPRKSSARKGKKKSSYKPFEAKSTIKNPTVLRQQIDGTIQSVRKGKDFGDMAWILDFTVEVPASTLGSNIKVDVVEKGTALAVTFFYSPHLLYDALPRVKQFGGYGEETAAAEAWKVSCDEIRNSFPVDVAPHYTRTYQLCTPCSDLSGDVISKVAPIQHSVRQLRDKDHKEYQLHAKLKSIVKVHKENKLENFDDPIDILNIAEPDTKEELEIERAQLMKMLEKERAKTERYEQEREEERRKAYYSTSSSSTSDHGMSYAKATVTHDPPIVPSAASPYIRRQTSSSFPTKPTFQDPLASGSSKFQKSVVEMTQMASKNFVANTVNRLKGITSHRKTIMENDLDDFDTDMDDL